MTPEDLISVMPAAGGRANIFAPLISAACDEFQIDTQRRQAAALAQIAHESGSLLYMEEIADGSAYEGRLDLGNVNPGDGARFKGRGPIQITGRTNYRNCGLALGLPLLEKPELLELPQHGTRAVGWYWKTHGLNELADRDKFGEITRRINGGYRGLDERLQFWLRARKVFGL